MRKDKGFVTITNQDIYELIKDLQKTVGSVHEHVKLTNGRVTKLEELTKALGSQSIGVWISKHPLRFTLMTVVAISLLTPELRDAAFSIAKSLI